MTIPAKIKLIFLPPKILLRQEEKNVGHLHKIPHGFELKYLDQTLIIKQKHLESRKILKINDDEYLFSREKIYSLPQKKIETKITRINGVKTFQNADNVKIMKVISLGDIQYLEFLVEPTNFLFDLFVALFYLTL